VPQLICSNPFLAALDQELADAYRTALGASRQPEVLRASQVAWVAMRNAAPPEAMGIAGWYANRIDVLKHVNDPGPQPLSGADPSPSAELGSGFFVTAEGRFITNAHVVRGCYEIGIRQHDGTVGRGRVIANDDADDLALGQIDAVGQYPAISIRSDPPKLGEDILVFGFPLPGVLASSGNLTLGNITALSGLGDNTSMEQVSAPVQPGNSGGPVMDKAGNLVGVVVAKLDSEKLASITHGIPQNVNFAIKPAVLTNFLAAHSVAYTSAASDSEPLGTSAVAALSENVTVQVYCKPQ
jgi:S1-C subfamily serine protease